MPRIVDPSQQLDTPFQAPISDFQPDSTFVPSATEAHVFEPPVEGGVEDFIAAGARLWFSPVRISSYLDELAAQGAETIFGKDATTFAARVAEDIGGRTSAEFEVPRDKEGEIIRGVTTPIRSFPLAVVAAFTNKPTDPNFDPMEAIKGTRFERYPDFFQHVTSAAEMYRVMRRVGQQLDDRRLLEDIPFIPRLMLGVGIGFSDPINWVPVTGVGRSVTAFLRGRRLEQLGRQGIRVRGLLTPGAHTAAFKQLGKGGRVAMTLDAMIAGSAMGLAGMSIEEAIAQATLETQTAGETTANVAAGMVFAGVLHGARGFYTSKQASNMKFTIENEFAWPVDEMRNSTSSQHRFANEAVEWGKIRVHKAIASGNEDEIAEAVKILNHNTAEAQKLLPAPDAEPFKRQTVEVIELGPPKDVLEEPLDFGGTPQEVIELGPPPPKEDIQFGPSLPDPNDLENHRNWTKENRYTRRLESAGTKSQPIYPILKLIEETGDPNTLINLHEGMINLETGENLPPLMVPAKSMVLADMVWGGGTMVAGESFTKEKPLPKDLAISINTAVMRMDEFVQELDELFLHPSMKLDRDKTFIRSMAFHGFSPKPLRDVKGERIEELPEVELERKALLDRIGEVVPVPHYFSTSHVGNLANSFLYDYYMGNKVVSIINVPKGSAVFDIDAHQMSQKYGQIGSQFDMFATKEFIEGSLYEREMEVLFPRNGSLRLASVTEMSLAEVLERQAELSKDPDFMAKLLEWFELEEEFDVKLAEPFQDRIFNARKLVAVFDWIPPGTEPPELPGIEKLRKKFKIFKSKKPWLDTRTLTEIDRSSLVPATVPEGGPPTPSGGPSRTTTGTTGGTAGPPGGPPRLPPPPGTPPFVDGDFFRNLPELQDPGKLASGLGVPTFLRWLKINPNAVLYMSDSKEVRKAVWGLVGGTGITDAVKSGVPNPIFNAWIGIRDRQGVVANFIDEVSRVWEVYKKRTLSEGESRLPYNAFMEDVGEALSFGDKSRRQIPEAEALAKWMRKNIFDPITDEAIEVGELDPQVKEQLKGPNRSYLHRIYKVGEIADQSRFGDLMAMFKELRILEGRMDELGPADLEDAANSFRDSVLHAPNGRGHYDLDYMTKLAKAGPLKARKFTAPDWLLIKYGFLELDAQEIARHFIRTVVPDVEIAKYFGDPGMTKWLEKDGLIDKDYRNLIRKARERGDIKEANRLARAQVGDKVRLELLRDTMRNRIAPPTHGGAVYGGNRLVQDLLNLNTMLMLGKATVSSIPDMAKPAIVQGYLSWNPFYVNYVQSLLGLDRGAMKEAMQEMGEHFHVGIEHTLGGRYHALSMLMDNNTSIAKSQFEKLLAAGAEAMGKWSGLNWWTSTRKQMVSVGLNSILMEGSQQLVDGTASPAMRDFLLRLGVGIIEARKLIPIKNKYAFQRTGFLGGRVWSLDPMEGHLDPDPEIQEGYRIIRHIQLNESESEIVTPRPGDVAFRARMNPTFRLAAQYLSFTISSMLHTTLLMAQRFHDKRVVDTLMGVTFAIGLGTLSAYIKAIAGGRELNTDPKWWAAEGVSESAVLSFLNTINDAVETLSMHRIGARPLLGIKPSHRASEPDLTRYILGPTARTAKDILDVGNAALGLPMGEGISQKDVHAFRSLLPLQNHVFLDRPLDIAEDFVASEFDLPRTKSTKLHKPR